MAEYIDRGFVISIINAAGFWEEEDREVAITCVKYAEAADVAPVKHGRWKGAGMGDYSCSLCCGLVSGNTYKFCPNCGADMRGNSNE